MPHYALAGTGLLSIIEVDSSSQVSPPCNSELTPCYNMTNGISDFFFDNETLEGASNQLPLVVSPRRLKSRAQKLRQKTNSNKNPTRRRVSRRKIHRHSTRVLTLKPAVILLPPYETILEDNPNKFDPFIINVIPMEKVSNVKPEKLEDSESVRFDKTTPRGATRRRITGARRIIFTRPTTIRTTPAPTTTSTTIIPTTPKAIPHPDEFLLPPLPDAPINYNDYMDTVRIDTQKSHVSFQGYSTTVPTISYELVSPLEYFSTSENPFDKLEKEYNEIVRIAGGNNLEQVYNQTETNDLSENNSKSSGGSINEVSYFEWSSTPTYNETIIENSFQTFNEERHEILQNDYNPSISSFTALNNSLLAPDVASLGMKILTSKKGLEMLKEFSVMNSSKSFGDLPTYDRDGSTITLETAETGDFRLRNYDNQIESLEDAKEVPKEAYRALKGSHNKPFRICNGNQGYVADAASGCQIFYICLGRGAGEPMMCPNGTLFNQDFLVCDWWYNVECNPE